MKTIVCLIFFNVAFAPSISGEVISQSTSDWRHVTFDDIPPTKYLINGEVVTMVVDKSASIRLLPFKKVRGVKKLAFAWKLDGELKVKSAAEEESKAGDDSALRVGLVISGKAPWIPFFAPSWVKALRDVMHLPTDRLVYFAPGSRHKPGQTWVSPYSDSIQNVSIASVPSDDGWQVVQHDLAEELSIVGLWIMADGDDSKSTFTTTLKDLSIE